MRYFCTSFLLLITVISSQDGVHHNANQNIQTQNINQDALVQEEEKILEKETQRKMQRWVAEQFHLMKQNKDIETDDGFIMKLNDLEVQEFRWTSQTKMNKKMQIRVFTEETGNDLTLMRDPDEDNYIQIEVKYHYRDSYQPFDKVYIMKTWNISIGTDGSYFKFTNLHGRDIIVEVGLQGNPIKIDSHIVLKNDHFTLPAQKLSAIQEQMKVVNTNRNKIYKWSWGFLQRQQHYQEQMLKLTAFQLLVILATEVIQMYCIKGLMDNKQVI